MKSTFVTPKAARRMLFAWIACYTVILKAYAAAPASLSAELAAYDFASVMWAAIFGLMGGLGRYILGLMSKEGIVVFFWRALLRDLIYALIGGAFIYLVFLWLQVLAPNVFVNELRLIAIFVVGASRGKWYDAVGDATVALVAKARAKYIGGDPPPDPPAQTTVSADINKQ